MNIRIIGLAIACVAACVALVTYKVAGLGYSLSPRPSEDRWSVQLTVTAQGKGESARLRVVRPLGDAGLPVYDEQFLGSGLKELPPERSRATFEGRPEKDAPVSVTYSFSTRTLATDERPVIVGPTPADLRATTEVPADHEAITAKAGELAGDATGDLEKVRRFYDYVLDEIGRSPDESVGASADAAVRALLRGKGDGTARVRLFTALARSQEIPARIVRAVTLEEGSDRQLVSRAEVWLDGRWVAVDPVRGLFGSEAEVGLALVRGDGELIRAEGLQAPQVAVTVAREGANEFQLFRRRALQSESFVDSLSLYNLPPRTQLIFRVLLLVPLGALIVASFRTLIGVPTFGTFMPILIALSLRETRPLTGLLLLAGILVVGLGGRKLLEGLRLLLVPRLGLLLTFVIFAMAGVALIGAHTGSTEGLAVAVLPMVIMTMTIERLSVVVVEEGLRSALKTMAGTMLVAATGYAAIQADALQRIVFTFPELNLLVVAGLILLGRYTGYRLSEVLRFRSLVAAIARRDSDSLGGPGIPGRSEAA